MTIKVTFKGGAEAEPAEYAGAGERDGRSHPPRHGQAHAPSSSRTNSTVLGATFNSGADLQSINISAEFLSKDLGSRPRFADGRHPPSRFPEDEMKKVVAQYVDTAKSLKDNPDAAAWEYYRSFFYGASHPYGRPADELTYARIGRKAGRRLS